MRTIYITTGTILIIILISVLYYFSTKKSEPEGVYVKALIDITDLDSQHIQAKEIIGLATNNFTSNEAITIRTEVLSNYHINPIQEFKHPKESLLTGNFQRKKRSLEKLTKKLDSTIQKMYAEQSDKNQSNIFLPLLSSINELSKSKAKNKVIVCASDLQENNKTFSCFNSADIELLKKKPELAQSILLNGTKVNKLRNTTIYFIHHPRNERDDELFMLMALFYKQFYEKYGAVVHVQNNLITL